MNYNPFTIEGKTILITGASSGIGRATAIECAKMGAHCVITGRNVERLQVTYDQLEGEGHLQIVADLADPEALENLATACPQLDGIVNNAGMMITKPIPFLKQKDLDTIFGTNTFAPVILTKLLMKQKKINRGGSIVFTSSIATTKGVVGNSSYGMTKAAIEVFAKYCALEFADKKIRVNSIHPGMIETKLIHDGALSDEDMQRDLQNYPLGRYGHPEEVAWAIIYLLSDASVWVTGNSQIIDGGCHLS